MQIVLFLYGALKWRGGGGEPMAESHVRKSSVGKR